MQHVRSRHGEHTGDAAYYVPWHRRDIVRSCLLMPGRKGQAVKTV